MTNRTELESWHFLVPVPDSATLRIASNNQRINILRSLNEILRERRCLENRRNSLLQSAVLRQHQVQELRNKCDNAWQQKLSSAQAFGNKIENECILLKERRDAIYKQLMSTIEGNAPCKTVHFSPSIRANYKIQASLLQKDIAELKRRVLHTKLRLDSEIKGLDSDPDPTRSTTERSSNFSACATRESLKEIDKIFYLSLKAIGNLSNTVKKLRIELGTKRLNSMSIRPQTLALLTHANQCRSSRENFRMNMLKNTARTSTSVTTPREKRF